MDTTDVILRHVRRLGYHVTEHAVNGVIEMHAAKLPEGEPAHVARCNDGDGTEERYRCVCLLAAACGVGLVEG